MGDLIVILVLGGIVALAVTNLIRDQKRGKTCSGCASCHLSAKSPKKS